MEEEEWVDIILAVEVGVCGRVVKMPRYRC